MTKKLNVVKFFLAFAIVTIFITGIYLCVLIPTLNSTQKTIDFDEPELILQDEADFVIDGNGTFTSFSADAKSKINDVETFGVILPAKVKQLGGGFQLQMVHFIVIEPN